MSAIVGVQFVSATDGKVHGKGSTFCVITKMKNATRLSNVMDGLVKNNSEFTKGGNALPVENALTGEAAKLDAADLAATFAALPKNVAEMLLRNMSSKIDGRGNRDAYEKMAEHIAARSGGAVKQYVFPLDTPDVKSLRTVAERMDETSNTRKTVEAAIAFVNKSKK